jgi:dTDP-glucose 4,6-dehydratase/UDP-glucuronate decarboxylase
MDMQKPSTAANLSSSEAPVNGGNDVRDADLDYIAAGLGDELRQLEGRRLLITGGAGFLGYYLVQAVINWNRRFAANAIQLDVFDNYLRGIPAWLAALNSPQLKVTTHDMRNPLPDGEGPWDFIIHAAGIASPKVYRQYPLETMDANINGLRHLLDMAARTGVSGMLFFSSSEIYGDPPEEVIPTPETYRGNVSCTGPRACYDESKRYGETLCVTFAQHYGVPVRMARPFNNYGPGMNINDGRVIADFSRNILAGQDIVLLSDGAPTRTFCYVADAIIGYYKVLVRGRAGEPYNIGVESPEISMAALASLVVRIGQEQHGYEGAVVQRLSPERDYLVDNPSRRRPSIEKARSELAYAPSIDLDEGIRRTLAWYAGEPAPGQS